MAAFVVEVDMIDAVCDLVEALFGFGTELFGTIEQLVADFVGFL